MPEAKGPERANAVNICVLGWGPRFARAVCSSRLTLRPVLQPRAPFTVLV